MNLDEMKVLVIGDVFVDKYIYATVGLNSREAPIPILNYERTDLTLGGAGNVYRNLVGIIGSSKNIRLASIVSDLYNSLHAGINGLLLSSAVLNNTKTRILSGSTGRSYRLTTRLDNIKSYDKKGLFLFKERILEYLYSFKPHAIVFSDYGLGLASAIPYASILNYSTSNNIKIFVDSRNISDSGLYGMYAYTPNREEFEQDYGILIDATYGDVEKLVRKCINRLSVENVLLKLGCEGNFLVQKSVPGCKITPAMRGYSVDTIGAGDSSLAGFVVGTLMKNVEYGAELANTAGEESVMHQGTYAVNNILNNILTGV